MAAKLSIGQWFTKYWYVPVLLLALALAVTIFLLGRKSKKTGVKAADYQFQNPNEEVKEPETYNPGPLTTQLYNDMKGNSVWSGHKNSIYKTLLGLHDNKLIAVAKDWAERYADEEDGKSLFERLSEEKDYTFTWSEMPFWEIRDKILERAKNLKIYGS